MASFWQAEADQPRPGEITNVNGRSVYIVALGDNLSFIAKKYCSTVEILVQANNLQSALIVPGQQLWVPRTYVIEQGDTLYKIAREHKTTVEELLNVNNIDDPDKINAGDIMLLP